MDSVVEVDDASNLRVITPKRAFVTITFCTCYEANGFWFIESMVNRLSEILGMHPEHVKSQFRLSRAERETRALAVCSSLEEANQKLAQILELPSVVSFGHFLYQSREE